MNDIVLHLKTLSLREAKRQAVSTALLYADGHAEIAANLLGIGASTMYRLIKELKITKKERYPRC